MGASGTADLDFGAFPGVSDASVAVTGQAGIGSGSLVEAWIRPVDTMSKSEFTRRTQFMDHRSRDGVLRTLAEAGLIETVMLQNKGRPSQWIKVL